MNIYTTAALLLSLGPLAACSPGPGDTGAADNPGSGYSRDIDQARVAAEQLNRSSSASSRRGD